MDGPLLLALSRLWLRERSDVPLDGAWASGRALGLRWAGRKGAEAWVLLLQPKAELWLLGTEHPAWLQLQAEAPKDSGKLWGPWLQGARLRAVEGDPRERWLGLVFQRRAITGRAETLRIAYQAIPGRAGIRVDGLLDTQVPRLGLGSPFPATPPEPTFDPPPLLRWRERWGANLDAALAGLEPEVLEGEGDLLARHRAWAETRAEALVLGPSRAAAEGRRGVDSARLGRLAQHADEQVETLLHQDVYWRNGIWTSISWSGNWQVTYGGESDLLTGGLNTAVVMGAYRRVEVDLGGYYEYYRLLTQIEQPSQRYFIADTYDIANDRQFYRINKKNYGGNQQNGLALRHNKRAVAAFWDGHAEGMQRSRLEALRIRALSGPDTIPGYFP